jgi:gamma-glutamyl:cysteine ligase YbdK (ATP-grasp superfamily)
MVAKLTEMGARVNVSCGFHVHVGFAGNAEALARLVHLTAYAEPALRASTGSPDRDRSRYCRSIKNDYAGLKGLKPATLADVSRVRGVSGDGARYHTLNLTNLLGGRRPTVEFRAFSGTLNLKKIVAYVQLCLGLTQRAINVTRVAEWDAKPLTAKSAPNCYREGRPGTTEVNRLLAMLGWSRTTDKQYGIVLPETVAASVATLRELAEKYDAARTPRAAAVPVATPAAI